MQAGELGTCKTSHDCMIAEDTGFTTAETIDNSGKGKRKNYREVIPAKNDPRYYVANARGPPQGGGRGG